MAFGTVKLRFAYLGERRAAKPAGPESPAVTARFLPIPGQQIDPSASGPRFVHGSEGIGVYGAPDVSFDRPRFWQVSASATIGGKVTTATAAFEVLERSPLPAPGDPAPRTFDPARRASARRTPAPWPVRPGVDVGAGQLGMRERRRAMRRNAA